MEQNRLLTVLAVIGSLAVQAWAQPPKFEVASIKPTHEPGGVTFGVGNGGGGGRNVSLKTLMAFAWRLQEFQISGASGWVGSDRFDIEAKAANPSTDPDQLRIMLQSLITERFQLQFHFDTRETAVYLLTVSKGGPKMHRSGDQFSPTVNGPPLPGAGPNRGALRVGSGSLIGNAVPLSLFTRLLSQRAVLDRTGLSGRFEIELRWTPGPGEMPYDPGGNPLPPADVSGPSVFAAIQEQLGLKLESARGPVQFLVIDQVRKPSAN